MIFLFLLIYFDLMWKGPAEWPIETRMLPHILMTLFTCILLQLHSTLHLYQHLSVGFKTLLNTQHLTSSLLSADGVKTDYSLSYFDVIT